MRVDKVESTTVIQIQSFAESSTESICTEQAAVADTNSKCYSPSPYSPSTIDSQVSGSNISIYGQNLLRIHLANFALMNPTPMGGAYSASGNTSEKKPNHALLQSSQEATRYGYHFIAATQATPINCWAINYVLAAGFNRLPETVVC
ncbi:hypothetical protein D5086_019143 [Populus alba]|uniref:Uncharacterized protein n=1 Tax=Populus alba TaxID=43335 RepID=A0ACC4BGR5_POPAL